MAEDGEGGRDRERLLAVYKGWRKAGRSPMHFSWRKPDASGLAFFALAGLLLILVTPVDAALWGYRDDAHLWAYPLPISGRVLLWVLLPVCLLNAFLINRLLSRKTPTDYSTRWQILASRWLASSLPLFGLVVVPVWQRLLKDRPAWMLSSSTVALPDLALEKSRKWPLLEHWMRSLDQHWLLVAAANNCTFCVLASHWIQRVEPASPSLRWWPGLLFSITLHLLMFAGMVWHLRGEVARARAGRPRSLALLFLTACLLPPIPVFSILVFMLFLFVNPTNTAEDTLIHGLLSQRGTTRQLPAWLELREKVQQSRRAFSLRKRPTALRGTRQARLQGSEASRRIRLLLRRKTLLLIPDTIALSLTVPLLAKSWPWTSLLLEGGLACAGLLALPLLVTGVTVLGIRAALRREADGRQPDQHPFGVYLVRTAGLFFLGLVAGHVWRRGQIELLETLFLFAGVAGFRTIGLKEGRQVFRQLLDLEGTRFSDWSSNRDVPRPLFSMIGMLAAAGFMLALARLGLGKWFAIGWLACSVLWGIRLARVHLPWLLRLSPGQQTVPGLPRSWRLAVALIRLTVILPLGGLAVPLWLLACHRLKPAEP
jgi:hypothetical protein